MKTDNPHVFSICMGWDAFRLCIGADPKNFTSEEVVRWIVGLSLYRRARAALTAPTAKQGGEK